MKNSLSHSTLSSASTKSANKRALRALGQLPTIGSTIIGHASFFGGQAARHRRIVSRCLLQSCMNSSRSMISLPKSDG
jgi:hypothetical protein